MQINPILGHFLLKHDATLHRENQYKIKITNSISIFITIRTNNCIDYETDKTGKGGYWVSTGRQLHINKGLIRILEIIINELPLNEVFMSKEEFTKLQQTKKYVAVSENSIEDSVLVLFPRTTLCVGSIRFWRPYTTILKIIRNEEKYFL